MYGENSYFLPLPSRGPSEKMSTSATVLPLFRQICGSEIDILATSTSFRHLFDRSFTTGVYIVVGSGKAAT